MERNNRDSEVSPLALAVFAFGRSVDIYTTYSGLRQGFEEAHPVSRTLIENFGLEGGLTIVNSCAVLTSYLLARTFNKNFRSSLTERVGDSIFIYGGAIASCAVGLVNQLRLCGYIE